ncbi:hypothetical protein ACQ4PT_020976 [Festuca glaucescens]
MEGEMEIDPVQMSESRIRRPVVELEEALPFVARKRLRNPDSVLGWQLAEELKDLEETLSLAARTEHENIKLIEVVDGMGPLGIEEALSIGYRRKVQRPEEGKTVKEWQPEAELEEVLSLAVRSGLMAEETKKFLRVAAWSNLTDHDVRSLAIGRGIKNEEAVSLANNFLTIYRIVFTALHAELLASFDRVRFDPKLSQWERFGRFVKERKKKGPDATPFLLFKIKASAKSAKVSWWRKEYGHFPPERQGYTAALRVARVVVDRDGSFRLLEAGEDGQPGALSHGVASYSWADPRMGMLKDGWLSPHNEVAVIRSMPGGEGISIMSYVDGLGVKLDITGPVENLIQKLYQMYEQEDQEKKMFDQQDPQERQDMMCQHEELGPVLEEEKRKKMEDLRRRKEEKLHRKEKREAAHQIKMASRIEKEQRHNEDEEDCLCTPILMCPEESDWVQPLDEETWQSEEAQRIL